LHHGTDAERRCREDVAGSIGGERREGDLMAQTISLPTPAGPAFDAVLAMPTASSAPALIFIPSIYGNTDGMKNTIDRYASHGYIVLSLDPFWRTVPGPLGLDQQPAASARKDGWTVDQGLDDTRAALAYLRTLPAWNGKFAMVGYCFGGRLSLLGLMRLGADAAVTFHGTAMHLDLAEAGSISAPFSFHYGSADPVVPLDQVELVRTALAGKDGEIYVYEGAAHSFAQEESPRYSPEAGPLSEARALAMLERLKTP
jgi:carboxymethylenebutenolidase